MLTTAIVAALSLVQADTQEMRLLRYPNVRGDHMVFTYASDLWTADTKGGIARRLTSHPNNETRGRYSPDGSMLAFTASYDGNEDVYVMPAEGGNPKRLTFDSAPEYVAGWTPGGKIAYVSRAGSTINRLSRLWLIDPRGGLPQPTPILEAADISFSPDGNKVAYHRLQSNTFNWRHYRGGTQGRISIYDLSNNSYSELPSGRENSYTPMWIGNSIYYVSDKEKDTINLYRYDLGSKQAKRLTDFEGGDIKWPSTDGKTIVFERDGYLYSYDVSTDHLEKENPRVLSDDVMARPTLKKLAGNISYVTLSPSGNRIAVETRGELFSVPVKTGDTRDFTNTPTVRERYPEWSPDGQTIAYASDAGGTWQIYTQPQMGGAATKLTELPSTSVMGLNWSPDSKKIAFTTRDYRLRLLDVSSKQVTEIDRDDLGWIQAFDWSPDSKWVAYIKTGKNFFGAVHLYDVVNKKATQITEGLFRDDSLSFDTSGKYLYVVSGREVDPNSSGDDLDFTTAALRQRVYMIVLGGATQNPLLAASDEEPVTNPEPAPGQAAPPAGTAPGSTQSGTTKNMPDVQVDLEGAGNRIVPLPMPAGQYPFIVGVKDGVLFYSGGTLSKFDVASREITPIASGQPSFVSFNPARSKMAVLSGGRISVVDVRPGAKLSDGTVDLSNVEGMVDPRAEWKQMFWDAWRWERDNYYDPKMRGLDWQAVGDHYANYLPYVAHRGDLSYVIGLLISELGTSHTYTGGGDPGMLTPPIPIGQLGADYEAANGKVRFKKIYRGASFTDESRGPLGDPGVVVKEGDYLLAIDGKPVDENTNPNSLMLDKVNKYVTLTVNSTPSDVGARKVRVRPIGDEANLRYQEWIDYNRRLVEKWSGGRIGYVHVPNTAQEGAIEFVKGYYRNVDKDALVVDERFNGGGLIPTGFIDILSRNYQTFFVSRHGTDFGFPVRSIDGPKAMLINGYAGSGGDMFPYLFKREKLGPLIGTRTWGGLVGYNEQYALSDGGWVSAPEAAFYEPRTGKWIAENNGIEPDIEVDARPDLIYKGEDPQLKSAVDYLLKKLKENPPAKNKRPEVIPIKH